MTRVTGLRLHCKTRPPVGPAVDVEEDLGPEYNAELFGGAVLEAGRGTVRHSIEVVNSAELKFDFVEQASFHDVGGTVGQKWRWWSERDRSRRHSNCELAFAAG